MAKKTDEEYAYAAFLKRLEDGDLKDLDQQDCTKTLLASTNPVTLDLFHERLDEVVDVVSSPYIGQIKKLRLKAKDRHALMVS